MPVIGYIQHGSTEFYHLVCTKRPVATSEDKLSFHLNTVSGQSHLPFFIKHCKSPCKV